MEPDRSRLGRCVRARRDFLRKTQREAAADANMALQTWINVEKGLPVKPYKLPGIDDAMRWKPGSAIEVLAGGEPTELPPQEPAPEFDMAREIRQLRKEMLEMQQELRDLKAQRGSG